MKEFLAQREVFTVEELDTYLRQNSTGNIATRRALLYYYSKQGRIISVRRSMYVVVPRGVDPRTYTPNPYLIASKAVPDSIIGYQSALEFHGKAYSVHSVMYYQSSVKAVPFEFKGYVYRRVPFPKTLRTDAQKMFGIVQRNISGTDVRVTGMERTFVDMLNRPELTGSWEEIWKSLEFIEFFDMQAVIEYVSILGNATTAAIVGFFLEQHQDSLLLRESDLEPLYKLRPQQPHYMVRSSRNGGILAKRWNLIVPNDVYKRTWEDIL